MHRPYPALAAALLLAACAAPPPQPTPAPATIASPRAAQPARPLPHPVDAPRGFARAVERGTRTTTGEPGPRYWQQWARYDLRASVDPQAKTLTGTGRIVYHNRSPDTLRVLNLHLHQNLHAPGVVRNEAQEVTGGVELRRLAVGGQALGEIQAQGAAGYAVNGTQLLVRPPRPLLPGDSVRIDVDWGFKIPQAGAGRMGWSEDNLLFLAYWYPQMAVYDDVVGWHTDPYLGTAEFYLGYGNYDITIDAPAGWVVMATGELRNAEQVLPGPVLERYRRAMGSDSVVHVLTAADFGAGRATVAGTGGRVQWVFHADTVRDASFSATRESLWDAARTGVGDRDGDGREDHALVHAFWRSDAPRWQHAWRYAQQSIWHHSRFTGVEYPYPHMTTVEGEGIIGGGMEFPMMTLIGAYTAFGDTALYGVTSHEIAHMWVPMIVGVDEKRYAWMDEGTTNFNENEAKNDFYRGAGNFHHVEQGQYVGAVRGGTDAELLRWSDFHYNGNQYGFASYTKPATVLHALRGLLGEETFIRAYRKYLDDWTFRHPQPWDFFNAFNRAAGRDLSWFWGTWYDETWTLDQAVRGVTESGPGNSLITIEDRGRAVMPARLLVTRADGSTERHEVPVETWLSGAREATVTVSGGSPVTRVEIDPERWFPDVDRANNVWTR